MAHDLAYLVVGLLIATVALTGGVLGRLPASPAMLYLGAGVVIGPAVAGLVHLDPLEEAELVEVAAEIVVLVSLLAAGLKLRTPLAHRRWVPPVLLATVAMVATAAMVAALGVLALGLPLGAAIVLGAVLAPTDPVLASDVQTASPWDRDRVRFTLTGEAGLNDATAFPLVILGLGLLGAGDLGPFGVRWLALDLVWAGAAAIAIGAALGTGLGRVVVRLRSSRGEAVGREELIALGLLGVTYGAAELCQAYGFLAVFVAGLAFRRVERQATGETGAGEPEADLNAVAEGEDPAVHPRTAPAFLAQEVLGFTEAVERASEALIVLGIGALLLALDPPTEVLWFAPALFLVIRPLAVLLVLAPLRTPAAELSLIGWFGIRGVGSLFYLGYALVAGGLDRADAELITALVLTTVAASIIVHGVSVTPLMQRYESRRAARTGRLRRL